MRTENYKYVSRDGKLDVGEPTLCEEIEQVLHGNTRVQGGEGECMITSSPNAPGTMDIATCCSSPMTGDPNAPICHEICNNTGPGSLCSTADTTAFTFKPSFCGGGNGGCANPTPPIPYYESDGGKVSTVTCCADSVEARACHDTGSYGLLVCNAVQGLAENCAHGPDNDSNKDCASEYVKTIGGSYTIPLSDELKQLINCGGQGVSEADLAECIADPIGVKYNCSGDKPPPPHHSRRPHHHTKRPHHHHSHTSKPTPTPGPTPGPAPVGAGTQGGAISTGGIVGIIVGSVAGLVLTALLIKMLMKKKKK